MEQELAKFAKWYHETFGYPIANFLGVDEITADEIQVVLITIIVATAACSACRGVVIRLFRRKAKKPN